MALIEVGTILLHPFTLMRPSQWSNGHCIPSREEDWTPMRNDIDVEHYKKNWKIVLRTSPADRNIEERKQHRCPRLPPRLEDLEWQRIQSALARIRSGDFGYCILCEEKIAERRLRFDPSMPTCISCARRVESG